MNQSQAQLCLARSLGHLVRPMARLSIPLSRAVPVRKSRILFFRRGRLHPPRPPIHPLVTGTMKRLLQDGQAHKSAILMSKRLSLHHRLDVRSRNTDDRPCPLSPGQPQPQTDNRSPSTVDRPCPLSLDQPQPQTDIRNPSTVDRPCPLSLH